MWNIENRLKFLKLIKSFKNEYFFLAFEIVAVVTILILNFGYLPNPHLAGAIFIMIVIFLAKWKGINWILNLEDEENNIPLASNAIKSYLVWVGIGSIFTALISFYAISWMPTISELLISSILTALVIGFSISNFNYLKPFLIFSLPIEVPLLIFLLTKEGVEFKILAFFNILAFLIILFNLKTRANIIEEVVLQKIKIEEQQKQINKEAQNLQKYIELLDEVDIGTAIVDNKNRIIYYSNTLQKWFNISENMSFDRFFASIIRDINELNKKEIVSKSGRTYKVVSGIIEDIDNNMYYLKVFKDTTKEYKYSKSSFRESVILPEANEYDKPTQLLKRAAFFKYLDQTLYEADITNTKIALMIININDFDYIKETYGKKVADEILKIIAKRLNNSTRDSDLVGRYGESELIAALKLIEDLEIVELIAKKIQKNLIKPFRVIDNKDIFLTVSIGIAIYPDDTKDLDKLEFKAYQALKEAKKQKRSGYLLFRDIPPA